MTIDETDIDHYIDPALHTMLAVSTTATNQRLGIKRDLEKKTYKSQTLKRRRVANERPSANFPGLQPSNKKNKQQQQPHDHHETFAVHFYTTEEQYIHYTVHINSSINETSSFTSNFKVA